MSEHRIFTIPTAIGLVLLLISLSIILLISRYLISEYEMANKKPLLIDVSQQTLNPANEKQWVYITGVLKGNRSLVDSDFKFPVDALSLKRQVEMRQWKQISTQENQANSSYQQVWSETLIPSINFQPPGRYQNPRTMAYGSKSYESANINIGAFSLDTKLLTSLKEKPFDVNQININQLPLPTVMRRALTPTDNYLYLGSDATKPNVGDIRFSFSHIPWQTVTIIGQQVGRRLEFSSNPPAGIKAGLYQGKKPLSDFISLDSNRSVYPNYLLAIGVMIAMIFGLVGSRLIIAKTISFNTTTINWLKLALNIRQQFTYSSLVVISLFSLVVALAMILNTAIHNHYWIIGITLLLFSATALALIVWHKKHSNYSQSTNHLDNKVTERANPIETPTLTQTKQEPTPSKTEQIPSKVEQQTATTNLSPQSNASNIASAEKKRYAIAFKGEVIENHDVESAKSQLAALLKLQPQQTKTLFSGKTIILKKNIDSITAKKYRQILQQKGAKVYIINQQK